MSELSQVTMEDSKSAAILLKSNEEKMQTKSDEHCAAQKAYAKIRRYATRILIYLIAITNTQSKASDDRAKPLDTLELK